MVRKCPECGSEFREAEVEIAGASTKAVSYQCSKCDYFEFEPNSSIKVVEELKEKEAPIDIEQKLVKLSKDRLGMYLNKNIVRSLDLKAGELVHVSVPDKRHIVINLGGRK